MSTASFACAGTPALGRAPSLASEALPDTRAWAYLVRCADGSLYAGWTTDLARRLRRHKAGQGAKYTKMRGAVTLAYAERCEDKSAALCREAALKKLDKPQKEALAAAWAAEHALKIRLATEADAPAVAKLYNWYVRHSTATFQYAPATVEEMRANIAGVLAGAPFLVAETASGRLAGYACAHPYHAREAYAWSVETTIYCSPDFVGQGVGGGCTPRCLRCCVNRATAAQPPCWPGPTPKARRFTGPWVSARSAVNRRPVSSSAGGSA